MGTTTIVSFHLHLSLLLYIHIHVRQATPFWTFSPTLLPRALRYALLINGKNSQKCEMQIDSSYSYGKLTLVQRMGSLSHLQPQTSRQLWNNTCGHGRPAFLPAVSRSFYQRRLHPLVPDGPQYGWNEPIILCPEPRIAIS